MINNKKGTILVVAVTAMIIMILIGLVCMQLYYNQSIIDSYDATKKRTFYSAEAGVEMMKGYILRKIEENKAAHSSGAVTGDVSAGSEGHKKGFLVDKMPNVGSTWSPFAAGKEFPALKENFDATMHPAIVTSVYVKRLGSTDVTSLGKFYYKGVETSFGTVGNAANSDRKAYVIISEAKAAGYKTALNTGAIVTTIKYYFYTNHAGTGAGPFSHDPITIGWRID